ncbi:hypothetical protein ACFYO9_20770 [Streptomyces sp. NPDC005863]|uniref:hypothetical protein n=1 Tax=unclassified Streptomyces TaxID=2593676 RepID=UPI0033FF95CE
MYARASEGSRSFRFAVPVVTYPMTPKPSSARAQQAIQERVGKQGMSTCPEKAAKRQIEHDSMDELIETHPFHQRTTDQ